jgi:DNA-binding NarL/FixJ family response regulator
MRVVIADDAPLIREGVARLLTENGVEVVDKWATQMPPLRASATYARM